MGNSSLNDYFPLNLNPLLTTHQNSSNYSNFNQPTSLTNKYVVAATSRRSAGQQTSSSYNPVCSRLDCCDIVAGCSLQPPQTPQLDDYSAFRPETDCCGTDPCAARLPNLRTLARIISYRQLETSWVNSTNSGTLKLQMFHLSCTLNKCTFSME
jgi:hypothetical protein